MPEVVICPYCEKKARVPDSLLGKKVKCPGCGKAFQAEPSKPAAPPPPSREEKPRRQEEAEELTDFEVVDEPEKRRSRREEDEDDDRPRRRSRRDDDEDDDRPRRRSRRDDDEDDEDDDRPRRRSRRDEDEDDEDDDRPRRRSRRDDEDDEDDDRPRRRSRRDDEDDEDDRPRRRSRRYDDYDRPRRSRRITTRADWQKIHRGLNMCMWAALVSLITPVVVVPLMFIVGGTAMATGSLGGLAAGGFLILLLWGGAGLTSFVLKIVGSIFCLPSPEPRGARILALITLILLGVSAVASLLSASTSTFNHGMATVGPFAYFGGMGPGPIVIGLWGIDLGAFGVFLFYMRSLALVLKENDLLRRIIVYVIAWAVTFVVGISSLCTWEDILFRGQQALLASGIPTPWPSSRRVW